MDENKIWFQGFQVGFFGGLACSALGAIVAILLLAC